MSLNQTKQDTALWDKYRAKIYSKRGGWRIGKGVYNCGYDMMNELVGEKSYMQVMFLNATGRLPDRKLADWLEAVHICLSWPDPRIWCNHIGALGGTVRASVVSATVAGTLAGDSKAYGQKTLVAGVSFIQKALAAYNDGISVEEIISGECAKHGGKPIIMGFARPIAKGDERAEAMARVSKLLGFSVGPHMKLAYQIEDVLSRDYDESLNICGFVSAFLSDQNMTPEGAYQAFALLVSSGVTACYLDVVGRPAGTFSPLQCEDIEYQGAPARALPVSCP
ncbi:MAG: hypothetical protein L3J26_13215 [Candidatus Polarisedimenticolaceae bacterium]|nr:hypothetical protein [Candidatus Polarisedimenticolaceae bacterium]